MRELSIERLELRGTGSIVAAGLRVNTGWKIEPATWFLPVGSYAAFRGALGRHLRSLGRGELAGLVSWADAVLHWFHRAVEPEDHAALVVVLSYRALLEHWENGKVDDLVRRYDSDVLPDLAVRLVGLRPLWLTPRGSGPLGDKITFLAAWLGSPVVTEDDRVSRLIGLHQMVVSLRQSVRSDADQAAYVNQLLGLYIATIRTLGPAVARESLGTMVERDFRWFHGMLRRGEVSPSERAAVERILRRRFALEPFVDWALGCFVALALAGFVATLLLPWSSWSVATAALVCPSVAGCPACDVAIPPVQVVWLFVGGLAAFLQLARTFCPEYLASPIRDGKDFVEACFLALEVVVFLALLACFGVCLPLPLRSVIFLMAMSHALWDFRKVLLRVAAGAFVGWLFFFSGAYTDLVFQTIRPVVEEPTPEMPESSPPAVGLFGIRPDDENGKTHANVQAAGVAGGRFSRLNGVASLVSATSGKRKRKAYRQFCVPESPMSGDEEPPVARRSPKHGHSVVLRGVSLCSARLTTVAIVAVAACLGVLLLLRRWLEDAGARFRRWRRLGLLFVYGWALSTWMGLVLTTALGLLLFGNVHASAVTCIMAAQWAGKVLLLGAPIALLVGLATQVLWQEGGLLEEIGS